VNGGADARVSRATAQIALHRGVNLRIGRFWRLGQQRCRTHDLSALAITALRHVEVAPRLLQPGQLAVLSEAFNRRYLRTADLGNQGATRALCHAVNMHGARATFANATTVFGADQIERVAQDPEERGVGFHLHRFHLTVDI